MRPFRALLTSLVLAALLCASSASSLSSAASFDEPLAIQAAWTAGAAYCGESNLTSGSCGLFCEHTASLSLAGTFGDPTWNVFGFVGVDASSQRIWVSFRGTLPSSLHNWIINFDTVRVSPFTQRFPDVSLHRGFYDTYMSVQKRMLELLKPLVSAYPSFQVVFTGHSLGAALATIAAFDSMGQDSYANSRVTVITFGSPRVGNAAFSALAEQTFGDSMWRVVHASDIVPHLPPEDLGFQHVAREYWFTEMMVDKHVQVPPGPYIACSGGPDPSGSESPTCSDSVPDYELSVEQHFMYMGIPISMC